MTPQIEHKLIQWNNLMPNLIRPSQARMIYHPIVAKGKAEATRGQEQISQTGMSTVAARIA